MPRNPPGPDAAGFGRRGAAFFHDEADRLALSGRGAPAVRVQAEGETALRLDDVSISYRPPSTTSTWPCGPAKRRG
ncbi:MAG: hypothetical protein NXH82_13695 [Rhodobacteraceae bacterium]|nr:hypothetical protein [Paracoccaceae bacterium]